MSYYIGHYQSPHKGGYCKMWSKIVLKRKDFLSSAERLICNKSKLPSDSSGNMLPQSN